MAGSNSSKPLTALSVKRFKFNPSDKNYLSDAHPHKGLRFIANKNGTRTWIYRFRSNDGKLKQVKIGHYPEVELSAARVAFTRLRGAKNDGNCPAETKKQKRVEAVKLAAKQKVKNYTLNQLCTDYLVEHIYTKRKPKGQRYIEGIFRNEINGLGALPATEVKRSDIHALVQAITARPAPSLAKRIVSELRAGYEHAVMAGRVPETTRNPCLGIKTPAPKNGIRFFNDSELTVFIDWLPSSPMSQTVRQVLSLMLYSGCRGGELVSMRWDDIDLDAGTWNLDSEQTKTGAGRVVQLSTQAVDLLKNRSMESNFVFPTPNNSRRPISQNALGQAVWHHGNTSNLERWSAHDIRRTVRTGLSRLRCPSEVAEAIIGHSRKGIEGVYDLHRYEGECKHWLQVWSDHLDTLREAALCGN